MSDKDRDSIAQLLVHCEEPQANGQPSLAPAYVEQPATYKEAKSPFFGQSLPVRTEPVVYSLEGEEIFVVSDLHISSGRNSAGVYKGTENFFADDSFKRFLDFADRSKKSPRALLIINGDIFDFLRVTEYPGKVRKVRIIESLKRMLKFNPVDGLKRKQMRELDAKRVEERRQSELAEWSDELAKVGIAISAKDLGDGISKREMKFGLGTADYKTIYKLIRIKHGHPAFFDALASWLAGGNKLMILKGNHDLELYWPAVRNYLRLILAENIAARDNSISTESVLRTQVLGNITFIDDAVEIDKDFYVEHGHRYDKFTMVLGSPTLPSNPTEINLPFGSFINRYLINRIELFYPFLDNVRPTGNVLPMLLKENFPLGVKVLLQHGWLLLKILLTRNMRYVWFMFHKVAWVLLAILLPVLTMLLLFGFAPFQHIASFFGKPSETGIKSMAVEQLQNVAAIFMSYLLSRIVAWFQLTEPSSLDAYARLRFESTTYRIMTMGHTHNPGEYVFGSSQRFYNTGTWIPVIESSTADVREDKTYSFLHLERDADGKLQVANNNLLQRWNDDAQRADLQVLLMRK